MCIRDRNWNAPAVLFFHAMGVTGESSEPVANYLQDRYFCILPTSTVYCKGQKYVSKADEVRQVEAYLKSQGVERLELVVASSIGADLAMAFLTGTKLPIGHVFFDGGQFAQIAKGTRRVMTPFLYFAIKSLYWSKGGTLKKILWCDDDSIKPYFIAAGENLTYTNLRRQLSDSLEDKPFPSLPEMCIRDRGRTAAWPPPAHRSAASDCGNFSLPLKSRSRFDQSGVPPFRPDRGLGTVPNLSLIHI